MQLLKGAGAPANNQGDLGDAYLDTDSGQAYFKTDYSTWTQIVGQKGDTGAQGDPGDAGATGSTGATGPAGPAQIDGLIRAPIDETITLIESCRFAGTLDSLYGSLASGTLDAKLKINGVDVTGSSLSVSSTPGHSDTSAAKTVAIGDRVSLVVSSSSSPVDFSFSIGVTPS